MSRPVRPDIPTGLEGLMGAFIAEMVKDLDRIQGLLETGGEGLPEHLHAMRGKCAMFGEDILFNLLTAYEAGDAGQLAAISARVEDLRRIGQEDA